MLRMVMMMRVCGQGNQEREREKDMGNLLALKEIDSYVRLKSVHHLA